MYKLQEIERKVFGGQGVITYMVTNYDGNREALQKQLDEKAMFWENYYIYEYEDKTIVKKDITTLD